MKVYIVFVALGGDDGEVLDRVYADQAAAEARVRQIDDPAMVAEYWAYWRERNPKGVGLNLSEQFAAETGREYLGEAAGYFDHASAVYFIECEVL